MEPLTCPGCLTQVAGPVCPKCGYQFLIPQPLPLGEIQPIKPVNSIFQFYLYAGIIFAVLILGCCGGCGYFLSR